MNAGTKSSSNVVTIHSLDATEVDTRVRGLAALDAEEARALTTQIQRTSVRLWMLVTEAHDRRAHLALGYDSWADYVKAELNMSESRSYQFLETGHVMKALAGAGVDIETIEIPPTRVVARVKDRLTEVRKVAQKAIKEGESVDKAIRALAREPRGPASQSSEGGGGAAAAATAPAVPITQRTSPENLTACPACAGSGKVTKTVAERLLQIMQKYGGK